MRPLRIEFDHVSVGLAGECRFDAPRHLIGRGESADCRTWLLLAGRGFGKTRSGAECIRDQVIHHGRRRIALVAPTAADARDVMVEGESGTDLGAVQCLCWL